MPLIELKGNRWKYGKTGHVYSGSNARAKARAQGQAIELSKMRAEGKDVPPKKSTTVHASTKSRAHTRDL